MHAQLASGPVNRGPGAFELDKCANWRLVYFDKQTLRPPGRAGILRGAVFFVAKPAPEAETFENFLQRSRVDYFKLGLFANFVAATCAWLTHRCADCQRLGRTLKVNR